MSPKSLKTLQVAADYVAGEKRKGTAPELIILSMIRLFGAKRTLRACTNTLRCGTVSATCTWSRDKGLLDAWNKNATVRLAREAMQ